MSINRIGNAGSIQQQPSVEEAPQPPPAPPANQVDGLDSGPGLMFNAGDGMETRSGSPSPAPILDDEGPNPPPSGGGDLNPSPAPILDDEGPNPPPSGGGDLNPSPAPILDDEGPPPDGSDKDDKKKPPPNPGTAPILE